MLSLVARDIPFVGFIIALTVSLILVVFKTVHYRRLCFIECASLALICVLYVLFKNLVKIQLLTDIIVCVLSIALLAYAIYDLFFKEGVKRAYLDKANTLIKNAQFDYYYATNEKDIIVDFSESLAELTKLKPHELYDTLGFPTLMSKLYITHINGEEITSTNALRLNSEYELTKESKKSGYFELTVMENNEEFNLLGVVEPVYYKNRFIGRNVYLSKNNKHTLNKLQDSLQFALNTLKDNRSQLYVMMSMIENVVLYYDYNTSTYVMTEVMAKSLGLSQREYNINDFINLIHPSDLQYYQEQSTIISSNEVTRVKYRLKLGMGYYKVYEDSIYLSKEGKLISIIHLVNYQSNNQEQTPNTVETQDTVKEVVPQKVDYKEKLEDTMKVLEKLLGE